MKPMHFVKPENALKRAEGEIKINLIYILYNSI
jgi:hypothetical protein